LSVGRTTVLRSFASRFSRPAFTSGSARMSQHGCNSTTPTILPGPVILFPVISLGPTNPCHSIRTRRTTTRWMSFVPERAGAEQSRHREGFESVQPKCEFHGKGTEASSRGCRSRRIVRIWQAGLNRESNDSVEVALCPIYSRQTATGQFQLLTFANAGRNPDFHTPGQSRDGNDRPQSRLSERQTDITVQSAALHTK
jgi:hypothetical protein